MKKNLCLSIYGIETNKSYGAIEFQMIALNIFLLGLFSFL